jgi:hypothetical protein
MDEVEARAVLGAQMASLQEVPYQQLVERLLDQEEVQEAVGASGTRYQIELQGLWDAGPHSVLRVSGSVDDGGWRSLAPVTSDFLIAPDGAVVGEQSADRVADVQDWRLPRTGVVGTAGFLGRMFARSFVAGFSGRSPPGWPPTKHGQRDAPMEDEKSEL